MVLRNLILVGFDDAIEVKFIHGIKYLIYVNIIMSNSPSEFN